MDGRGSEFSQHRAVGKSGVPFVLCQPVEGVLLVEGGHDPVARHLGQNAGGRDAEGQRVALVERGQVG